MKALLMSLAVASFALTGLVAPGAAGASSTKITTAKYSCNKGQWLKVTFKGNKAIVTPKGRDKVTLYQGMAADGFLYSKGKYSLGGRGKQATWIVGRNKPLSCTALR
jgi:membrane-bound inhibitor of C-type lysozyme